MKHNMAFNPMMTFGKSKEDTYLQERFRDLVWQIRCEGKSIDDVVRTLRLTALKSIIAEDNVQEIAAFWDASRDIAEAERTRVLESGKKN